MEASACSLCTSFLSCLCGLLKYSFHAFFNILSNSLQFHITANVISVPYYYSVIIEECGRETKNDLVTDSRSGKNKGRVA